MPDRTLRALWVTMAQLRLLDNRLSQIQPPKTDGNKAVQGYRSVLGEEACRVSTTMHLIAGDCISETPETPAAELLHQKPLAEILHHACTRATVSARSNTATGAELIPPQRARPYLLPATSTTHDRIQQAIGAAAALKASAIAQSTSASRAAKTKPSATARPGRPGNLVLAFLAADDLSAEQWKPLLRLIAQHALPILLVVLPPRADSTARDRRSLPAGRLSQLASRHGIPGILVDSDDPVALYRVATESSCRIRGGDGAVLIECSRYQYPSRSKSTHSALDQLRARLVDRQLVTSGWFDRTEHTFHQQLDAAA